MWIAIKMKSNDKESAWILRPIKIHWNSIAPLPEEAINGTKESNNRLNNLMEFGHSTQISKDRWFNKLCCNNWLVFCLKKKKRLPNIPRLFSFLIKMEIYNTHFTLTLITDGSKC